MAHLERFALFRGPPSPLPRPPKAGEKIALPSNARRGPWDSAGQIRGRPPSTSNIPLEGFIRGSARAARLWTLPAVLFAANLSLAAPTPPDAPTPSGPRGLACDAGYGRRLRAGWLGDASSGGVMANGGEEDGDWDVWAFNDAIKKSASFEPALSLLRQLERSEVAPNAVTYHGIMSPPPLVRTWRSLCTHACAALFVVNS